MGNAPPDTRSLFGRFFSSRWKWSIIILGPLFCIAAILATEVIMLLLPCWFASVLGTTVLYSILILLRIKEERRLVIAAWSFLVFFLLTSSYYIFCIHRNMGIIDAIKYQLDRMWMYAEGI